MSHMSAADRSQHLSFINGAIERMTQNQFVVRGWCITLVSAILAFALTREGPNLFLAGVPPIIVFWLLDAYYLGHERKFRALYDQVRTQPVETIDFTLSTEGLATEQAYPAFFSPALLLVHGGLLIALIVIYVITGVPHAVC